MTEAFEQFCIVELMGRQVIAGKVTEQVIGGQAFVRVDVPGIPTDTPGAANGIPTFTKFYGAGAIYAMTPCDEATAQAATIGLRQKPVNLYQLNLPPRSIVRSEDDEQDGEDSFERDDVPF